MITDCAIYEGGQRRPGEVAFDDTWEAATANGGFVWLDLAEPSAAEFERVRREFDLHELAVEDAIAAHQRPKLEVYGDSLFVVVKTARYVDPVEVVELDELMVFLGASYVIVVRHGPACDLPSVRGQIEQRPDLLAHGPGAVLWAILDQVVDDYVPVIEGVDNDIDEVEQDVFSADTTASAERIYKLKREVLQFHHATSLLTEPLDRLARGRVGPVPEDLAPYFRDVYDHLLRVTARVGGFRELLTSVLEANLTQVSVRQNEDMRKISAWVAIAAVPTMIAGIYGMNFDHMPELRWTFGYPLVLLVIAVICGLLYRSFQRSGWL